MIDRPRAAPRHLPSWPLALSFALAATAIAGSCVLPGLDTNLPDGAGGAQGSTSDASSGTSAVAGGGEGGSISVGSGASSSGVGGKGASDWGDAIWADHFNTEGAPLYADLDVAATSGGLYIGGTFAAIFTPPGGSGPIAVSNGTDAFRAGYTNMATFPPQHTWGFTTEDAGDERAIAVMAGASGVAFLGTFTNTFTDKGGGTSFTNAAGTGVRDVFIAKTDINGSTTWTAQLEEGGPTYTLLTAEVGAMAPDGTVFVAGYLTGSMKRTGDPAPPVSSFNPSGIDIYIARTSADGSKTTFTIIGNPSDVESIDGIAADNNSVYVAGRFKDTMVVGVTDITSTMPGVLDSFVIALSPDNMGHKWHEVIRSETVDTRQSLTARFAGGVVLAGTFVDTLTTTSGTLTSAGMKDAFVISIAAGGGIEWAQSFGGPRDDVALDIAEGLDGSLFVTGSTQYLPDSYHHLLLAELAPNGLPRCVNGRGGPEGSQEGRAIAVDEKGEIFIIGAFGGTMELVKGQALAGGGSAPLNVFLAKYPFSACQ